MTLRPDPPFGGVLQDVHALLGRRPEHDAAVDALATAYVRPHEIDIPVQEIDSAVSATVDGEVIDVEIPRDRYEGHKIRDGQAVYLTPRRARFFPKPETATAAS